MSAKYAPREFPAKQPPFLLREKRIREGRILISIQK
jgi:hypothetical protein